MSPADGGAGASTVDAGARTVGAGASPGERPCPVCDVAPLAQSGVLFGYPLLHCAACGHDCLWTQGTDLSTFYQDHYDGFRDDPVFVRRLREVFASAIAPRLPPGARVLDVGCGNGEFLLAAQERGHRALGIDFAQAAADACAKRGLRAVAGDFLTRDFGADGPFDLVSMWDVCEHLDRPFDFMRRAHELLRPRGWLVLKVPCLTPRALRISQRLPAVAGGLLGSSVHVQYFRPQSLRRLLRRAGFAIVDVQPVGAMRGRKIVHDPVAFAKREIMTALHRIAGNGNALVLAQIGA